MTLNDFLVYYGDEINVFDTSDKIWDCTSIDIDEKLDLSLELIKLHPEYSIFSRIKWNYSDFSENNRKKLWETFAEFIRSGKETVKKEIEYSLYVDFFEDGETVEDVWKKFFEYDEPEIDEVLIKACGPVPFDLKKDLYYKYIQYKNWHPFIFDSLNQSFFGPFGDLPVTEGLSILNRLKVEKSESFMNLQAHLKKYKSQEEYIREMNKKIN